MFSYSIVGPLKFIHRNQPAHMRSLIRASASRLNILWVLIYRPNIIWSLETEMELHRLIWVYTCQNATLLEITRSGSNLWTVITLSYISLWKSPLGMNCFISWFTGIFFRFRVGGRNQRKKKLKDDQLTGHFQSVLVFFFRAFLLIYPENNSKTNKVNQQSVLNL